MSTTFVLELLLVDDYESEHCQSNNGNYYNNP